MSQTIPIFYTISDDFAPYAAVAIESLLALRLIRSPISDHYRSSGLAAGYAAKS